MITRQNMSYGARSFLPFKYISLSAIIDSSQYTRDPYHVHYFIG